MASFKQMAGAILAIPLFFTAQVAALPTAGITGLSPQANQPLSCFDPSGTVVDQGWKMWMHASAFCQEFDLAIIPVNGSITASSYQAVNGNYYNLEVANVRCDSQQVRVDDCMSLFSEILVDCNTGANDLNVGGLVSTDCGHVTLLPSVDKVDTPGSTSSNATHAVRDIYPDGCNPPVWSACSSSEKAALLDNACDFSLCLKAGNCAPC